ncbi:MAG: ISKra4 family transposase [Nitrososphaerales archaeon]
MASARNAVQAFSPLDEELALLPGALTPSLQEDLVRLGAWMPFGRAAQELQHFRGVDVSRATAERLTEAAGAAYVAVQTAEVARIEKELPKPPPGPAKQFVSVDGAMVPLVGGVWAEVRTLVIGEVQPPVLRKGEPVIHTTNLSYFSRLSYAETFQRLALVETQRRGVETAQAVAAVTDGAEWIPQFLDFHRHDAVRILDFPHAGEHLNAVGQAVWGEGSGQSQSWLEGQLHSLKHAGPGPVLAEVRRLASLAPQPAIIVSHLCYLEKRQAQMQYPAFLAAGWPIGDGAVESANKLVVEARLKGSGMHWARPHVDPMLALRNIVCSDRWDEAWPQIMATLCQQARQHRAARRAKRRQSALALSAPTADQPQLLPAPAPAPTSTADQTATPPGPNSTPKAPARNEPWRPAANHPWRRMPIGRARFRPPLSQTDAKT